MSIVWCRPVAWPDHTHWVRPQRKFFLPGDVLAEVFRGKFHEALEEAFAKGKLGFHGNLKPFARPKSLRTATAPDFSKEMSGLLETAV